MRTKPVLSVIAVLLACAATGYAQINIAPYGIAVQTEELDTLFEEMSLINGFDEQIAFNISLSEVDQDEALRSGQLDFRSGAPLRDRRGEPDDYGYFWNDNAEDDGPEYQWIEIANRQGAQRLNLADNGNSGELELGFEFPWYGEWYETIRVCTNGWFAFGPDEDGGEAVLPECPNENRPNNIVAVEALDLVINNQSSLYFWTDGEGQAIISWNAMMMPIAPIRQSLTFQAILDAETGTVKLQYGLQQGIQNNLICTGYENQDGSLGSSYVYHQAGIAEGLAILISGPFSKWLLVEPRSGVIDGNDSEVISLGFIPEEVEAGTHEMRLTITSVLRPDQDDAESVSTEVSAVLTYDAPAFDLQGSVVTEEDGFPIAGARISLDRFLISRNSGEEGDFLFTSLPNGVYHLNVTAPDYLPAEAQVEVDDDNAEVIVSLRQPALSLDPESLARDMAPGEAEQIRIVGTNIGNGPLTYSVERRLPGDANAEPWEVRREYAFGRIVDDDRIEGAAFDGERFYLSGANGDEPNLIYVLDRDGELIASYVQPGDSRYGMKDLEYDGELLWGSGEQRVFGFTGDGNIEKQFQGPINPTVNIAYDSDRDLLWLSGTTSNISAYTRDGEATGQVLNRRGLRMYGFAYWPDDPDGYPLYVLHSPEANVMKVHKFNPENGDTMLARILEAPAGASPGGAFITNAFDVYSWVMMVGNNIPGGDRNVIYQLDARRDWFEVDPVSGVIEAGERQEFELTLDAAGLPAVEFNGELTFVHDGLNGITILPVTLNVFEGPVQAERTLAFSNGWNMVSLNIEPQDADVETMMAALVEEGSLELMKDGLGRFYSPSRGFNNIPFWNAAEGYWVKTNRASELILQGLSIMPDEPIPLRAGWQTVAYYPRQPVNAVTAFSGIVDHLLIAKDGLGRFYLPSHNFSNMGDLREGQGYLVKVDEIIDLVYRPGDGQAALGDFRSPRHFSVATVTGRNMSLLISGFSGVSVSDGSEIAAYGSDGLLAGSAILDAGVTGLAVWGDDPTTAAREGLDEGERFHLRLWDAGLRRDVTLDVHQMGQAADLRYSTDEFAVIEISTAGIFPDEFYLGQNFPNPFNASTEFVYRLGEPGDVEIGVFDINGREVAILYSGRLEAGARRLEWHAGTAGSGIYVLKLRTSMGEKTRKLILIK